MAVRSLTSWLRIQALVWLPALSLLALRGAAPPWHVWIAGMAISYAALVVILRAWRTAADAVTLVRFACLLAVVAAGWTDAGFGVWAAAVAVVLLDLADGALARRFGGTPQGATLDMETDQFTVLGLAVLVVQAGGAVHALVLPALRCVFVLAMWWLRAPAHEAKPVRGDNRRGRRVCAAVMCALLVALWPGLPALARDAATAAAALLLAWSFSSDARFLVAHCRARGAAA